MTDDNDDTGQARRAKYGALPPPVLIEETTTAQETNTPRDPDAGRDTDRDFMIRHAGG